jgi:hypothetical protein
MWITYFTPLLLLYATVEPSIEAFRPPYWFDMSQLQTKTIAADAFAVFADDIQASFTFSAASSLHRVVAICAVLLAFIAIRSSFAPRETFLLLAAAILFGLFMAVLLEIPETSLMSKGYRYFLVDAVFERLAPQKLITLKNAIWWNTVAGFVSGSALLIAVATTAIRDAGARPIVPWLRNRLLNFQALILFGGILFVLQALVNRSLIGWAQAQLSNGGKEFAKLGNALISIGSARTTVVALDCCTLCWCEHSSGH